MTTVDDFLEACDKLAREASLVCKIIHVRKGRNLLDQGAYFEISIRLPKNIESDTPVVVKVT